MATTKHEGRNVKRIREMLGIKQEFLADKLGYNQQKISLLEQKEILDPQIKEDVANALKVPVEAIENFNEDSINNFMNTFHDNSYFNYQCNINSIEKLIEVMAENKNLYERLLKSEKEKVELLESVLKGKN